MNRFSTAQEAFEHYFDLIRETGIAYQNTKALFNVGFIIENPQDRMIYTEWRKWSPRYAKREWDWYLSGNRNAEEIAQFAPIWKNMMDENGDVNSNYGYQWKREGQLDKVVDILKSNPNSRQAAISIFDGKEYSTYSNDTPCTFAVQFTIINNTLCMTVMMRSNDLWYGFCNDQYCFSKLQRLVAKKLDIEIGWYYHFATNMHIYNDQLNKKEEWKSNQ